MLHNLWALFLAVFVNSLLPHITINSDRAVIYATRHHWGILLVPTAALAQVSGKLLLFSGGRLGQRIQRAGLSRFHLGRMALERNQKRRERLRVWFKDRHPERLNKYILPGVVVSSFVGIPSFGLMALIAGWSKMSWRQFLLIGYTGRALRYLTLYLIIWYF